MKEEDFIRKKYGSGNPFKVPEEYFEQFTSELMSKLPEKEMKPVLSMPSRRRTRIRTLWYAVAAALCGAMFLGTYYLRSVIHPHSESPVAQYGETIETEDIYMDDVLDYAMVSNHEIALYLTDVY